MQMMNAEYQMTNYPQAYQRQLSSTKATVFSPKGASYDSPGQRPGSQPSM